MAQSAPSARPGGFNVRRRCAAWLVALAAGAIVTAGCSMSMTISRAPATATTQPSRQSDDKAVAQFAEPPRFLPDAVIDNATGAAQAPVVNVFGEFTRGARRGPSLLIGDPGLRQHTFLEAGYDADVAIDPTGKFMA